MDLLHLLEKPLKPSVVDFLRSQQCGFESGFPKVCCASLPKTIPILTNNPKKVSINVSAVIEYPDGSNQNAMTVFTTAITPSSHKKDQAKRVDMNEAMEKLLEDLSLFDLLRKKRNNIEIR